MFFEINFLGGRLFFWNDFCECLFLKSYMYLTILRMFFWSYSFFNSFPINSNILNVLKYIGIQYIENYHNLNSAMGAYYNTLGVSYNMGTHFLVTLKSGSFLFFNTLVLVVQVQLIQMRVPLVSTLYNQMTHSWIIMRLEKG